MRSREPALAIGRSSELKAFELDRRLERTTKLDTNQTRYNAVEADFARYVRSGCVPCATDPLDVLAADQVTRRERTVRESVTRMAEMLTGRLIDLDGEVFYLETDQGERIMFTLLAASGIQTHHLEGIVRSPVRIEVTIEGPHGHATATRVEPVEQHHLGPPPPAKIMR